MMIEGAEACDNGAIALLLFLPPERRGVRDDENGGRGVVSVLWWAPPVLNCAAALWDENTTHHFPLPLIVYGCETENCAQQRERNSKEKLSAMRGAGSSSVPRLAGSSQG